MRKKIAISLDRERFMRLDLNAMAEFEELTGHSLFNVGDKLQEAKNLRALLYASLKSGGEQITLQEVGELISLDNFSIIQDSLSQLMNVSYGKSDESSDGKK
jgi:hypothetical protein